MACLAALTAHADTLEAGGDDRSRGQIMPDTLVERLTGQETAADVDGELQIMMPLDALLDPDSSAPAELVGHGPIPAGLADQIIGYSNGATCWRRLFTAPAGLSGETMIHDAAVIVGGDPTARRFTGRLAKLITLRDRHCREPYCTAPIRHLDHIMAFRDGGPTSYGNGRGVCEHHNYGRELPGWNVERVGDRPHTTVTTTPTGHSYPSRAPDPP